MRKQAIWILVLALAALAAPLAAQEADPSKTGPATITGTVTDVNGDILSGATVVLQGGGLLEPRKVESDDNGFFEYKELEPGAYHLTVTAPGFGDWSSPELALNPGQYMIVSDVKLHITVSGTSVNVTYTPEEVATEEVKIEETQRVFGIIPNFYVTYEPHPAPLTTKLKFKLALRTSIDPVTIGGVAFLAGINQAGDTPNYRQGWKGYGERVGAASADGFSDIMIGGAILPSLLHQDPRYYYQGTGTTKSRMKHALSSPFICHGDNGKLQPNYSSIGGDLSSSALSNLYYPRSNRGADLVFTNFALSTGERMLSGVIQEFILGKLTTHSRAKQ